MTHGEGRNHRACYRPADIAAQMLGSGLLARELVFTILRSLWPASIQIENLINQDFRKCCH